MFAFVLKHDIKDNIQRCMSVKKKNMYLLCSPIEFKVDDDCNCRKLKYPKYLWLFHVSCSVELYSVRLYGYIMLKAGICQI